MSFFGWFPIGRFHLSLVSGVFFMFNDCCRFVFGMPWVSDDCWRYVMCVILNVFFKKDIIFIVCIIISNIIIIIIIYSFILFKNFLIFNLFLFIAII